MRKIGSCWWSCNWEKWGEVEKRPWQEYGSSDKVFVRYYQRRECKDCGKIEERRI